VHQDSIHRHWCSGAASSLTVQIYTYWDNSHWLTNHTTPELLHRPNYTTPPTTATPAIIEGVHTSPSLIKPAELPLLSLTRFTPSGISPTGLPIILHQSDYTDQTTPPLLLLRHRRSLKAIIHLHHRVALTQHSNNATRWQ
jgi:hypothetical protein